MKRKSTLAQRARDIVAELAGENEQLRREIESLKTVIQTYRDLDREQRRELAKERLAVRRLREERLARKDAERAAAQANERKLDQAEATPIGEMGLPLRVVNALRAWDPAPDLRARYGGTFPIRTAGDLASHTLDALTFVSGLGRYGRDQIVTALADLGLAPSERTLRAAPSERRP